MNESRSYSILLPLFTGYNSFAVVQSVAANCRKAAALVPRPAEAAWCAEPERAMSSAPARPRAEAASIVPIRVLVKSGVPARALACSRPSAPSAARAVTVAAPRRAALVADGALEQR